MKANPLRKKRAGQINRTLARAYPDAYCALNYADPLQLLIATILSAQCTDVRVNLVTPALFQRYPDAAAFANALPGELEKMIQSTGFFRNKTRSIIAACNVIVVEHKGRVPATLDELVTMPGIGRKTANVILGNAYGVPGITVDTHVLRLSRRMGLSEHTDAEKVERDLMELIPKKDWVMFSHRMIFHGRQICQARKPQCSTCPVNEYCPKIGVESALSHG